MRGPQHHLGGGVVPWARTCTTASDRRGEGQISGKAEPLAEPTIPT
jgi:hypothetical protein